MLTKPSVKDVPNTVTTGSLDRGHRMQPWASHTLLLSSSQRARQVCNQYSLRVHNTEAVNGRPPARNQML